MHARKRLGGGIGRPACRQAGALEMKWWVYALASEKKNFIYVGMSSNLKVRLARHHRGNVPSTKAYLPLRLIFTESCENRKQARAREKYWKSGIGKEQLRAMR